MRLYRALDRLLPHKTSRSRSIWSPRLGELFADRLRPAAVRRDEHVFRGARPRRDDLAKRGYSRDHRPDCVQVNIALVVTGDGMPLGYEVFAGNTPPRERRCEKIAVDHGGALRPLAKRVWVMDRGMASTKNIAWLQATGCRYVIGTPRSELGEAGNAELTEREGWHGDARGHRGQDLPQSATASRPFCCVARRSERKRRRPCTNASPSASSRDCFPCNVGSRGPRSPSTAVRPKRQIGRLAPAQQPGCRPVLDHRDGRSHAPRWDQAHLDDR